MNEGLLLLIALLTAVSAFAGVAGLYVTYASRRIVVTIPTAASTALPTVRELELAQPWRERMLKPLLHTLNGAGRLLTPARNLSQLQHQLILAGLLDRITVIDFLGLRMLAGAIAGSLALAVALLSKPFASALLIAFAGFVLGLYLPNLWLRSQIGKRQKAITRALPDALDRMSICVDAGLGFEAAIQKVALQGKNELAAELRRVIGEMRLGIPRAEALRHLVERTEVAEIASFVAVLWRCWCRPTSWGLPFAMCCTHNRNRCAPVAASALKKRPTKRR
jgi:tight adherence protein C